MKSFTTLFLLLLFAGSAFAKDVKTEIKVQWDDLWRVLRQCPERADDSQRREERRRQPREGTRNRRVR